MLVLLPLLTLFIAFALFKFLIPDYFTELKDLHTDKGIIQDVYVNKYVKKRVSYHCVNIILRDKPYYIRLSDNVIENYWAAVINKNNIGKTIQLNYQRRLLHGNILHDPNQISIDNKIIVPFDSKHKSIGWSVIIFIAVIIGCVYTFYVALQTYKADFYVSDKETAQKSKWKLFSVWLTE